MMNEIFKLTGNCSNLLMVGCKEWNYWIEFNENY